MTAGVAAQRVLEWLSALPKGPASRVHVVCDFDGDGLSAGALLVRALRAAGYSDIGAECRRKGESAWGAEIGGRLRDRAARHGIDALIVADMGSRDGVILRNVVGQPVPLLLIDHHRPTGQPQGSTLISSYGGGSPAADGKDIATSGLLSWWIAGALAARKQPPRFSPGAAFGARRRPDRDPPSFQLSGASADRAAMAQPVCQERGLRRQHRLPAGMGPLLGPGAGRR